MDKLRAKKLDEIDALLIEFRVPLTDYCIKKTHGDYNEVEDLIQDIMLEACLQRDDYDSSASEGERRRWLFSIARTVLFRYHQRKKRRIKTIPLPEGFDIADEIQPQRLMDLAHESLNDSDAELLQMRIDGYSFKEIAYHLGCSDILLRQKVIRCLKKIIEVHNIKKS